MKTFILTLFSISISCVAFSHPIAIRTSGSIDVLHYSFELHLSDTSDIITGKATIKVKFNEAADKVNFDFTSVKEGKGMKIISVTQNNRSLQAMHKDEILSIQLNEKINAGDTATFIISYKGIPKDGLIISKNKYGHRTFFADNWPNRGHNWIPCHDDPADKAPVEFIITAPQHYQVVANGIQVEETNISATEKLSHWKEDVPLATKIMVIGVADFAVNLSGFADCIPVYSWVYPEDKANGFYDYAQAAEILPWFIKNVGPYGYKKLANVQSKTTYGGLENASAIFYSENSITGTRQSESLLTHEIAHQWFGDMATEKSFAHLWLSEGFATYFTILYFENKYGNDTATYMRAKDREEVIAFSKTNTHPVVDSLVTDYMQLLNANSYQKGGWILHMLRRQLGDSIFWKSIRDYYATYSGKNADTRDLQKIFENNSGKKLDIFFTQWLYKAGLPSLKISWKQEKNKKLFVTINQLQADVFSFPFEIAIKTASGKVRIEKFNISKKEEIFSFNTDEKVISTVADPDVNLLFEEK